MAVTVVNRLEVIDVQQQQADGMPAALEACQLLIGQIEHMPAVEQPRQRVGGRHEPQLALRRTDDLQVEKRQVTEHGEYHAQIEQVHGQQGVAGNRLQRIDSPHDDIQRHVKRPQRDQRHKGAAQRHAEKQRRDEHQQIVVKATVPADQQRAQGGVDDDLRPDQRNGQPVAPSGQRLVRQDVHGNTDDIDPGQQGRTEDMKQEEKCHIHRAGDLATALGHLPELRTPHSCGCGCRRPVAAVHRQNPCAIPQA
ncbi:hypothetical protein D3C71_1406470 [compost metagenome]